MWSSLFVPLIASKTSFLIIESFVASTYIIASSFAFLMLSSKFSACVPVITSGVLFAYTSNSKSSSKSPVFAF